MTENRILLRFLLQAALTIIFFDLIMGGGFFIAISHYCHQYGCELQFGSFHD